MISVQFSLSFLFYGDKSIRRVKQLKHQATLVFCDEHQSDHSCSFDGGRAFSEPLMYVFTWA
jgi:hypothetical protein